MNQIQKQIDNGDAKVIEYTELEKAQLTASLAVIRQHEAQLATAEAQAQTLSMLIPQLKQSHNDLLERIQQAHKVADGMAGPIGAVIASNDTSDAVAA